MRRALDKSRASTTNAPIEPGALMDFVPRCFPGYDAPRQLAPFVDLLERAVLVGGVRAVVSAPPRGGKTDTAIAAMVKALKRNPRFRWLFIANGAELAYPKNQAAMRIALEQGVRLNENVMSKRAWETLEGGGVRAAGIGQSIIGHGADGIIIDDPFRNRKEAESRAIREERWNAYTAVVESRTEPHTSVIIMMQRWHEDDVAGRALATGEFEHVNITAVDELTESISFWPERRPIDWLRRKRKIIGEYDWVSQYMGRPKPRSGKTFADAVLVDQAPPTDGMVVVIGVDLAHTARTRSDWSVAVAMGIDRQRRIWILDVERAQEPLSDVVRNGRIEQPGFVRRIARLQGQYAGARAVMKIGGREDVVVDLLGALANSPVFIETERAVVDKLQRATPYSVAWNGGRVLVPRQAEWSEGFVKEHVAFTGQKGDLDDIVDAAVAGYDALDGGGTPAATTSGDHRVTASLQKKRYT